MAGNRTKVRQPPKAAGPAQVLPYLCVEKGEGKDEDGAKVLVHCMGGISRSPAVVAYYLMREEGMSLHDALGAIMKARPAMRPNDGFLRQLKELGVGLRGEGTLEGVELLPLETKKRQDLLLSADAKEK
ncbi:protein-tyrosine phosphatase-like protein [Apiospora aurea]|uniref:Protein-tyrosine phosphatase-like protein n=1 Tax=Apiospora aurea TaxID=335848 RepID=A0ABR1Q7T1_9PEZI